MCCQSYIISKGSFVKILMINDFIHFSEFTTVISSDSTFGFIHFLIKEIIIYNNDFFIFVIYKLIVF